MISPCGNSGFFRHRNPENSDLLNSSFVIFKALVFLTFLHLLFESEKVSPDSQLFALFSFYRHPGQQKVLIERFLPDPGSMRTSLLPRWAQQTLRLTAAAGTAISPLSLPTGRTKLPTPITTRKLKIRAIRAMRSWARILPA